MYNDLKRKALYLADRLRSTQAPRHLAETVDGLVAELSDRFDDVRPGMILGKSRTLAAALVAYDDADQREGLLPDALTALSDLVASLDDFKALFPEITTLEAARLAQGVGTNDAEVANNLAHEVADIAARSDVVDASAVDALRAPSIDVDITDRIATDLMDTDKKQEVLEARAKIIAQWLLDVRNFLAAALSEARREVPVYAKDLGKNVREGSLEGVKKGASSVVQGGFVAFVIAVFGPLAGLASIAATFAPLLRKAEQIKEGLGSDEGPA